MGQVRQISTVDTRLDREDAEWSLRGVCRTHEDPDVWHPLNPLDAWLGVAICHTCPVQQKCLNWAVEHNERGGTWGGLDEWNRAEKYGAPRKRRRAKKAS